MAASALVVAVGTAGAKDSRPEVRVSGVCGAGAASKLKLKVDDGRIELEFEVEHGRGGVVWRVALVRERRVVWKGAATTGRRSGSFEVRRTLDDLPGADTVAARAWGPGGTSCRATATLPGS